MAGSAQTRAIQSTEQPPRCFPAFVMPFYDDTFECIADDP
jgi:hypothetical protein